MIEVLPTDQFFTDSPDVGHPACVCSRCGMPITEEDAERAVPIRVWPEDMSGEYRYHPRCQGVEEVAPVWSDEP